MAERRPGTHSSPFGLPTFGAASALLGLLVAAFGLGRSTAPLPPGPQDVPVDPRAAAAQVALALQADGGIGSTLEEGRVAQDIVGGVGVSGTAQAPLDAHTEAWQRRSLHLE